MCPFYWPIAAGLSVAGLLTTIAAALERIAADGLNGRSWR
jgi:hypothetical protein